MRPRHAIVLESCLTAKIVEWDDQRGYGFLQVGRVSGARWPIECCFEEGKSELGMDHYEHRSWPAWHRHMRLVFLAQLFLIRLQIQYKEKAPALTLPQARLLLEGSFPRLKEEPSYRRHLSRYYQERTDQAYRSHWARTMKALRKFAVSRSLPSAGFKPKRTGIETWAQSPLAQVQRASTRKNRCGVAGLRVRSRKANSYE